MFSLNGFGIKCYCVTSLLALTLIGLQAKNYWKHYIGWVLYGILGFMELCASETEREGRLKIIKSFLPHTVGCVFSKDLEKILDFEEANVSQIVEKDLGSLL